MAQLFELRRSLRMRFSEAGVDDAGFEAGELCCYAFGLSHTALLTRREDEIPPDQEAKLWELAERRISGEPLQYILGEWEFCGVPIQCAPFALIPRPDTETLALHALELAEKRGYRTALDLCCGTGCIGVSLAKLGGLSVHVSDVDARCVALAMENAERNGVAVEHFIGDLFEPVKGRFDLICTNPPYIPTGEMPSLQREVQREPELALNGGEDGLDFYRRITRSAWNHLNPGGALLMEVGKGQARDVTRMLPGSYCIKDLNGIERVVVCIADEG